VAVDVGVADLIRSYTWLRDADSNTMADSAHLLHLYSVECGLKSACLGKMRINARETRDLSQELRDHKLRKLAKQLRLDGSRPQQLLECRRAHSYEFNVEHQDLHLAWRYGATLTADDEERAVRALSDLIGWCRKKHNR
jgi:hypothetical protein